LKRPAVHDQAMTVDVPSALAASRRERAWGLPSMIQSDGIGAGVRSTSAGAAKITGFGTSILPEKDWALKAEPPQKNVNRICKAELSARSRRPVRPAATANRARCG